MDGENKQENKVKPKKRKQKLLSVINGAAKVDDGIIEPDIQIMEEGEVNQPMAKKRKHSDTSSNSDHIINKPEKSKKVCSLLLL